MNKLSEKSNRGVFVCIAFSITCSLLHTISLVLLFSLYTVFAIAAFIILLTLMFLQVSKHCTHSTGRMLLNIFIVFYSIFNFLLFASFFPTLFPTLNLLFIIRIVFCIILIICFYTNKLGSKFFKVTNTIFFILALFFLISIGSLLFGIWEFIPIFLYFQFYNRIDNALRTNKTKDKSPESQLKELKEKFDSGVITLDEYKIAKQNILHNFITR